MKTAGLIFRNALKFIFELTCIINSLGSRSSLLVFHNRSNGFTIRSRCTLVLLLFLGLLLRLAIVASFVALGIVTIQLFSIPVVGVFYISRLT